MLKQPVIEVSKDIAAEFAASLSEGLFTVSAIFSARSVDAPKGAGLCPRFFSWAQFMDDSDFDFLPLRVTNVGANGKRSYDRQGKRRLIEACLEPGVSVASMAIRAQVNTNQLWRWVKQYKAERQGGIDMDSAVEGAPSAFVPVVEVRGVPPQAQRSRPASPESTSVPVPQSSSSPQLARLSARLPNGVTIELECTPKDGPLVKAMIAALGDT
ncbi:MAG: IS66-like element accessory protein TnpA [Pseudomonadales bacterium]